MSYIENHKSVNKTHFERAIFLSWYCSKADCAFCYMSTQRHKIKEPKKARRSLASIFAEAAISKACGWKIEFLSGGCDSFSIEELVYITKVVYDITGQKQWLNIGYLSENELARFVPFAEGFCGAVECVNPKIRAEVCPSKPLVDIIDSFRACDRLRLKKAMTLIIGLGETIDDFFLLKKFIRQHGVCRITFYSLNPHKGGRFKKPPSIEYYRKWIGLTRKEFPGIEIIAGAWHDKTHYFREVLLAGADSITKFPAIKYLGKKQAFAVEDEIKKAGRVLEGTLTKIPREVDISACPSQIKGQLAAKINQYLTK
ncbi:MAG: radical SAM protein [Candidatus Woesearchaeota archaeon]